ncbi:PAS domain S-box-containing protein [Evansella caseinilytica]|uniref:histidine kinase n=1 Tax=Evansella caseinilytica TaxID=1503961 RepID=A0A1H3UGA0_9BACI|nr:PAS domain-containing protein [Evansella caseinilytica]SDZ61091.1 PAS domain S-box-containing protein [Evansella caseinilytica]
MKRIRGVNKKLTCSKGYRRSSLLQLCHVNNSLFIHHPDAVFILNKRSVTIAVNSNVTALFGYEKSDLTLPFDTIVISKVAGEADSCFKKALQGHANSFEAVILAKQGDYIDAHISMIPIDDKDHTVGVYVIAKDISEWVEKEKVHVKTERNLLESQQIANIGSWTYDIINDEVYWSDQLYAIFQVEKDTFVPSYSNYRDFVHPKDFRKFEDACQHMLRDGQGYTIEYRIVRKDGTERIVRNSAVAILNKSGTIHHITGTIQDITEVKESEIHMAEKYTLAENITVGLGIGIWSIDMTTHKLGFCSRGIEEITGMAAEIFIQDPFYWKSLIHPDDLPAVEEKHYELIKGNKCIFQYRITDTAGNTKWIEEHTNPILDNKGNIIRMNGFIRTFDRN